MFHPDGRFKFKLATTYHYKCSTWNIVPDPCQLKFISRKKIGSFTTIANLNSFWKINPTYSVEQINPTYSVEQINPT
jgi:hypothetical protein